MTFHIGQKVSGTVTGIQPYGVFVNLDEQDQGLIHISEAHYGYVSDLHELFKVGEQVQAKVLDIDEYSGKISLSVRCLEEADVEISSSESSQQHKRYWTNWHIHEDFKPIADAMPKWLEEARRRFIDKQ